MRFSYSKIPIIVCVLLAISTGGVFAYNQKALKHYELATKHYAQKQNEQAIQELKSASAADPSWKQPYALLARIYTEQNKPNEAWAQYNRIVSIDPNDWEAWCNVAAAYEKSGDQEDA